MAPDPLMIEQARDRLESSDGFIREQLLLIADLRADGRPSNKAEDFLQLLARAQAAFREDLEFLQQRVARAG